MLRQNHVIGSVLPIGATIVTPVTEPSHKNNGPIKPSTDESHHPGKFTLYSSLCVHWQLLSTGRNLCEEVNMRMHRLAGALDWQGSAPP